MPDDKEIAERYMLEEQLAEAWHELQMAHLEFEAERPGSPMFQEIYSHLVETLRAYGRIVQQMGRSARDE